jgi:hypothetical protein
MFKLFHISLIFLLLTASMAGSLALSEEKPAAQTQAAEKEEAAEEERPAEQPPPIAPAPKAPTDQDEYFDEGLFEDVPPEERGGVPSKPAAAPRSDETDAEKGVTPRKITLDAVVIVNYAYSDSGESYNVKHHISAGGEITPDIGIIKSKASIATDISGYLAKTSLFECLLKITISDVPFELAFKKISETEADINISFKEQILENWESLCTFLDTSAAKFNTIGAPERWIGIALEKTSPPLSKIVAPIDAKKTTTLKFSAQKQSIPDEPLGTAQIEVTGVLTIQPQKKQAETPKNAMAE